MLCILGVGVSHKALRRVEPVGCHRTALGARLEDAGLPELFSPHSFRVTVVTDPLNQNVALEAARLSPTTTANCWAQLLKMCSTWPVMPAPPPRAFNDITSELAAAPVVTCSLVRRYWRPRN
jgi:hypothetical protein